MHPILLSLHGFTIYTYGFFVAVAMTASLIVTERRAVRFGFGKAEAADLLFVLFISGILGARIFYVWQHAQDFAVDWMAALRVQEGGLVWYGGLFGAILTGMLYARWRKWPILPLCDFFSPVAAMAHGIGRIGCFFNGCCYGLRTESIFGVHFPGEPYANLPTQLYEAAGLFVISGFLFYYSRKPRREGSIFLKYIFLYAMLRFVIEFMRGDNQHYFYLTLPQWMSIGLVAAVFSISFLWRKPSR